MVLAALLVAGFAFAQDEANVPEHIKIKNQGNEAYNEKDYVSAINYYSQYLQSGAEGVEDDIYTLNLYEMSFFYAGNAFLREKNYEKAYEYFEKFQNLGRSDTPNDGKFLYNFANTAKMVKKNDKAMELYRQCVALDYNTPACYFSIAQMFRQTNQIDSMKAVLKVGIEGIPQEKNNYYPKMVLLYSTQELKEAAEPFNKASEWSQKAAGQEINTYLANMGKAVEYYKQAIPMFEEVLVYPGVDDKTKANCDKAQANIQICKESIERFETYKKSIKK